MSAPTAILTFTAAYDRLIDRLRTGGHKVSERGPDQASAQCPAHNDRDPSLSITRIEGQALVHCHAGCLTDAVMAALGWSMADLFDDSHGVDYRYQNLTGQVVRTVHRTPDKGFRQKVTKGEPVVLYRLPQVVSAVADGRPVYLVEGEKDVHALEAVEVVATTAPMGASNFAKVDVAPLYGADVVAVVDTDEAGQKWAGQVWAALDGKARSLRFVRAAEGKDAADHVVAGHGVEGFVEIASPEPLPGPGVVTLADIEPESATWLWPGHLPAGKLVILDGDPSVGKSTLMLDLAARVSTGGSWPDGAPGTGPGGVLLLSAEDGLADTIAPRLAAAGADATRVHALTEVPVLVGGGSRMVPPSLPRDIPTMEDVVVKHGVRLVVVDVLMAYLNVGVDSHRDQDVRGVLHMLATMAERTGACIVLVRHLNKTGGANALYRGGGSIGIVGAARAAFLVGRDPEDEERRVVACTKLNIATEPPALAYRVVSDNRFGCARVEWEGTANLTAADLLRGPGDEDERGDRDACAAWMADYLTSSGGEAQAADAMKAGRAVGWSTDQIKRAKKRAGVRSLKSSMTGGWVWQLTDGDEGSAKGGKSAAQSSPPSSLPSGPGALPSGAPV